MKRLLAGIVLLALLAAASCPAAGKDAILQDAIGGIKNQLGKTSQDKLLADQKTFPAGQSICDWLAIAMSLAGADEGKTAYASALEAYVTDKYEAEGTLDGHKATEYHRIILTLAALGADPADVNGVDLLAEGTYNYAGVLQEQGSNGLIFALIALDCLHTRIPEGSKYTRESILEELLSLQNADGSFGLNPGTADIDITAMALQALAPYREQCADAVERALDWLSSCQTENGGFVSYGAENAESVAQTVIALAALGMDPCTDGRFSKNGVSLYDALLSFRTENGMFRHIADGNGDYLATAQAMLAVEAVQKQGSVYDMTDLPETVEEEPGSILYLIGGVAAAVIAAAAVIKLTTRRKRREEA